MNESTPHPTTFELGDIRIDIVCAGRFALDGGAMFGVVPKVLWSRVTTADDRNRIPLAMNCLLIRNGRDVVLVDSGMGGAWSEKERDIYALDDAPGLEHELGELGVGVDDVTILLNTHLHFDHAGGNTVEKGGTLVPRFPSARYVVQAGELAWAQRPTPRDRASFVPGTFMPVLEAGRFDPVEGDVEIVPGVSVRRVPGHTPNIQAVLVDSGGETLFYPSDLIPTAAHVPLPWVMAYDLEPLRTVENKTAVLGEAARKGWIVVLEHEPHSPVGRAAQGPKGVHLVPL